MLRKLVVYTNISISSGKKFGNHSGEKVEYHGNALVNLKVMEAKRNEME